MINVFRLVFVVCMVIVSTSTTALGCISGSKQLRNQPIVAQSGFFYAYDIQAVGTQLVPSTHPQWAIFNAIAEGQDTKGEYSEYLFWEMSAFSGCRIASGPKYSGNKGVDYLIDSRDYDQTAVVYEVKQWTDSWWNGWDGVQFSNTSNGYQLSDNWLWNVVNQSSEESKSLLADRLRLNYLRKAGAAVERNCGYFTCSVPKFWVFPVIVN